MRRPTYQLAAMMALCCGLIAGHSAMAATLVEDYDSFNLSGTYANWANTAITTITSGPTSYNVDSVGFGGGFFDINPQIDAFGETEIALDVTIAATSSEPGVILALVDGDGTLHNYAWYALADGNHILRQTIGLTSFGGEPGSVPGLDLAHLDFFHIQVDGGGSGARYNVSFNNLDLVPEPASFALAASGLLAAMCTRRRRPGSLSR